MTTDNNDNDNGNDIEEPDILVEKEDLLSYLKENASKKDKFMDTYTRAGWTVVPFIVIFMILAIITMLGGVLVLSIVFLFLALIWAIVYIPVFSISYILARIFKKEKKEEK